MDTYDEKVARAKSILQCLDLLRNRIFSVFCEETTLPSITPRQISLIAIVRNWGGNGTGIGIKEIADQLGVTTSSASTMVERLVEAGILIREPNPQDRRAVMVRVAEAMEKLIEPVERHALHILIEIMDRLGPDAVKSLCEITSRAFAILQEIH